MHPWDASKNSTLYQLITIWVILDDVWSFMQKSFYEIN